jgi:hypothetical protein
MAHLLRSAGWPIETSTVTVTNIIAAGQSSRLRYSFPPHERNEVDRLTIQNEKFTPAFPTTEVQQLGSFR